MKGCENGNFAPLIQWNLQDLLSDAEISEAIHNYMVSGFYLSKKFHKKYGFAGLRNYGIKWKTCVRK